MITKKRGLYLGLKVPPSTDNVEWIHYPIIKIIPRNPFNHDILSAFKDLPAYSHLIITSQTTVEILKMYLPLHHFSISCLKNKRVIAVGQATAKAIEKVGLSVDIIATNETSEGIVEELKKVQSVDAPLPMILSNSSLKTNSVTPSNKDYFFWPHSSLSRKVLSVYFQKSSLFYRECTLYDTVSQCPFPLPSLEHVDTLFFTSPSTISAFVEIFGAIPWHKSLLCQGPLTMGKLEEYRGKISNL